MSPAQHIAAGCALSRELLLRHQVFTIGAGLPGAPRRFETRPFGPLHRMLREGAA
jgi:hypothetical protein